MDKVLQNIGLAYKARKTILGEEVLDRFEEIKLLIIASDISEKSKERYLKKCHYYNVNYIDNYNSADISKSLGKCNIKIVGLIDEGFVRTIL